MEKKGGGLSIRSLDVLNKALINKWTWSFATERDPIWKRVIVGNLGKRQGDEGHARSARRLLKGRSMLRRRIEEATRTFKGEHHQYCHPPPPPCWNLKLTTTPFINQDPILLLVTTTEEEEIWA
uniref:Uncharacterized protein n=1 Tax=Vitis vinifera TaxID=29760 RepID=F6HIV1_VITVI